MRRTLEQLRPAITRAVVLGLLLAAMIALASSDAIHGAVIGLLEATRGVIDAHPTAGPVIFAVAAAISALAAFVSSAVLIPAAVYAWGPVVTIILLYIGWLLGGMLGYLAAAYLGRPFLRWLISPGTLARYERFVSRPLSFTAVLLLQLTIPSELLAYALGLMRYPLPRYLGALAIAQVPYAIGTVLLGVGFVERDTSTLIGVGVVGLLGFLAVAWLAARHTHR